MKAGRMDVATGTRSPRTRWWIAAIVAVLVAVLAVPAASLAHFMMTNAAGRITVVKDDDGAERTVYWRDYPRVAGLDPDGILHGPTAEEGYAAGTEMIAEIRAALATELELKWAGEPAGQDDVDRFTSARKTTSAGSHS
jgi:hypothetical protein